MSGERKIIKGEGGKKRKEQREFREAGETKKKNKNLCPFWARSQCQTLSQAASVQMLQCTKGPSRP